MRVILIPGLTDTEANLEGLVRLAGSSGFQGSVDLMPYHTMASGKSSNMGVAYEMEGFQAPSKEQIEKAMGFEPGNSPNPLPGMQLTAAHFFGHFSRQTP